MGIQRPVIKGMAELGGLHRRLEKHLQPRSHQVGQSFRRQIRRSNVSTTTVAKETNDRNATCEVIVVMATEITADHASKRLILFATDSVGKTEVAETLCGGWTASC